MRIENYPDGSVSFPQADYDPLVYEFMEVASKEIEEGKIRLILERLAELRATAFDR